MSDAGHRSIYVAGPMRGYRWYNFPEFDKAESELSRMGYIVVNPASLDRERGFDPTTLPDDFDWHGIPQGFDLDACIRRDIEAVLACDAIALLDGWRNSTGACAEHAVALWAGKEVVLMEDVCQNR